MTNWVMEGVWWWVRRGGALLAGILFLLLGAGPITGCGGYAPVGAKSASAEYEAFAGGEAAGGYDGEVAAEEMAADSAVAPMAPPALTMMAKSRGVMDDAEGGDASVPAPEPPPADQPVADPDAGPQRPLLIYRADLGLAVFRVQENLDAIEKMALDAGGYLVQRGQDRIVVRVPAKTFDGSVETILKMGDVHRREITAQDVTAEYTDLQIRLKNALAVRDRLEALLQNAKDVKEALKVEEQLGRVAEQIEVMKGRLKLLRELTTFSTITVEFSERTSPIDSRVELPFGWLQELGLNSLLSL